MFQVLNDFLELWDSESKGTIKILDALTDESLDQAVSEDDRTIARIAWHLVTTIHEMLSRTGLEFDAPYEDTEEAVPASAKEISDAYRKVNQGMIEAIKRNWSDDSLKKTNNMYGEEWPNSLTLQVLVHHQIHHRGQLTVLMRQANLRVPGIYGPSREEWSQYGMEAPTV